MNTRDSLLPLLAASVSAVLLCLAPLHADPSASEEVVAERLSSQWLANAQQICLPGQLILYHGTANGSYSADGKDWVGDVRGEILVLEAETASGYSFLQLRPSEKPGSPDPAEPRNGFTLSHGKTTVFLNPVSTVKATDLSPAQVANWQRYFASLAP